MYASDCGLDIKTWSDLISRHEKGERKRALHLRGSEIHVENNDKMLKKKNKKKKSCCASLCLQKVSPGMSDAIFHECYCSFIRRIHLVKSQ